MSTAEDAAVTIGAFDASVAAVDNSGQPERDAAEVKAEAAAELEACRAKMDKQAAHLQGAQQAFEEAQARYNALEG